MEGVHASTAAVANIVKPTVEKPDEVSVEFVTVPYCFCFSIGSPKQMEQLRLDELLWNGCSDSRRP